MTVDLKNQGNLNPPSLAKEVGPVVHSQNKRQGRQLRHNRPMGNCNNLAKIVA